MKRYSLIFLFLLVLIACQDESKEGFGYLQLASVELNKTIIPETKAEGGISEKLALDILKDESVIKHTEDWTTIKGESLLLPTGDYVVKAYSVGKDIEGVGFDVQPYYSGLCKVTVEKDIAKPVEVICKLAQCVVSVNYTDNFKKSFKTYTCKVENKYGAVDFTMDETRSAYFPVASISATLSLINTDNNVFTFSKDIAEVKAQYHYKLNYDVTNEGTGDFNIIVDQTTNNYIVNITVPLTSDADPELHTGDANAWGQFAYLYGSSDLTETVDPVAFQYKKSGETNWLTVEAKQDEDGKYSAKTERLEFATDYQFRIVCGAKVGTMNVFTTESFQEIPNLNFDTWTQNGKNWHANPVANDYEDAQAFWATGNTGVTSFLAGSKDPITVRVEDAVKGYAAKMTTITGVTLVEAAAGNLFIGKYKTNMSAPAQSVTFGRPYNGARPVQLSGYYKYSPKAINNGTYPGTLTTDECNIYVRLWDANDNEIGFGEFVGKEEVTEYTRFTIDIEYKDLKTKPAKMTIVATSSHYGGEFKGSTVIGQVGAGSTLWVDEFELSYYK